MNNKTMINGIGMKRCGNNPLLKTADVKPSCENFVVKGIFNCGAAKYKDEYLLLCRVAEAVESEGEDEVCFPVVAEKDRQSCFKTITIKKSDHPQLCFDDARTITRGKDGSSNVVYLTTLSHLRLARSKDGIHFTLDEKPAIMPNAKEECWGMEDPRITRIGEVYYINYTAVSPQGAVTSLIATEDFIEYERKGIIFLPENKDVAIFPERLGGDYYAFNRPVPKGIGTPDIWISKSPDMIHWGEHKHFYSVSEEGWENGRIGGGAPPVRTEKGWLKIYHAADRNNRYCLGAFLLDEKDPEKILAKSRQPLLEPEMEYEVNGFFGQVVFTCGCICEDENLKIYYGAADDSICMAEISLTDIYRHLGIR
ncbi:glycoside hydrolase family 130 protein [Lachnospiraceae bacterium 54-53]